MVVNPRFFARKIKKASELFPNEKIMLAIKNNANFLFFQIREKSWKKLDAVFFDRHTPMGAPGDCLKKGIFAFI